MTDKKMDCLDSVDKFFQIYKDNDYMLQRIYNHIVLNLPNTLENEAKNYEKRINLNSYLSEEQQVFMQVFLSKNNYYYLPNNGFFYEYNGKIIFIEENMLRVLVDNKNIINITIFNNRILDNKIITLKEKTEKNIIFIYKEKEIKFELFQNINIKIYKIKLEINPFRIIINDILDFYQTY